MADETNIPAPADPMVEFRIGGNTIRTRVLSLWDLQQCKEHISTMGPTMPNWDYTWHVVQIVAYLTSPEDAPLDVVLARAKAMAKSCSVKESNDLVGAFNVLLEKSGFERPDPLPPVAENPGTGTSTV